MPQRLLVILCILAVMSGCSGESGPPPADVNPVSGTVKVDGEPAGGVTVTFFPADGGGSAEGALGTTDESGNFTLHARDGREGAPAGKYRVLFTKLVKPDGSPIGPEEMAADVGAENALPEVYNNPTETPIGAEVPAGGKTFDFELRGRKR